MCGQQGPILPGRRGAGDRGAALPGLPAVPLQLLGLVGAVEKLPLEELHRDDGKYEHEEHVDNQDVEDVLQGVHHTVKHSLREGGAVRGGAQGRGHRKGLDRDRRPCVRSCLCRPAPEG